MADRHAPVRHTCPDIDKYLKRINWAVCNKLKGLEYDDLLSIAETMNDELNDCINYLEELRSSNGELRDWGHDLVSDLEYQDKEIRRLEDRVSQLEEHVQLHAELD